MKRWMSILSLAFYATSASAYHTGISETETADANASCNAAFHAGCAITDDDHEEQTHSASSSGFAAPAGAMGSSVLEMALIVLLVTGAVGGRLQQCRSKTTAFGNVS
jgi:hypothetical protein